MLRKFFLLPVLFLCLPVSVQSAELSGVKVDDRITVENGESLILNGIGLREKFWVDVYVGSLYLPSKTENVADILTSKKAWRIQMDFVYKEVDKDNIVEAWHDGFHMNQNKDVLGAIAERMDQFYAFFDQNVVAKDQYVIDYIPGRGTKVSKNNRLLGVIPGEDFRNALLEVWLGNFPADNDLKRGMLGH